MERKTFNFELAREPKSKGAVRYETRLPDETWALYIPQQVLPKPYPKLVEVTVGEQND
jgi:hypothetical protein